MTCPTCGSAGAYVGFTEVECSNARCVHHKPVAAVKAERYCYVTIEGRRYVFVTGGGFTTMHEDPEDA